MNIQTLRQAVKPQLPTQVDPTGVPVARLLTACQANLDNPSTPDPYGDAADTAQLNRDLQQLGTGAQADFGANPLSVRQLANATGAAAATATSDIEKLEGDKKDLKHAYYKQVGFTTAWMAGTAGSLLLGGVFPNPISLVVVGAACTMTIRSINKARTAHAELVKALPALEQNLQASREVAASAGFYAPVLAGWDDLLKSESKAA